MDVLRAVKAPTDLLIFTGTGADGLTYSKLTEQSAEAYRQISENFGLDYVITPHQVHSANIVSVSHSTRFLVDGTDGDGLFTKECGLTLGILTADCYPVMLAGEFCTAALHCGWRGAVEGIITKALPLFEKAGDRPIYAYVGVGISKDAFEVREDFIQSVSGKYKAENFLFEQAGGWRFDLQSFIAAQLTDIGVDDVEIADACTYIDRRFYSYRRDGAKAGRMLTVIHRRQAS